MNRIVTMGLPAAGLIALGAATSSLLGIGVAGAAPAATSKPATFQMYADVDAEGDLGSNSGAVRVDPLGGSIGYVVTFNKPIGRCAANVQPGKAGGPDLVRAAMPVVNFAGRNYATTKSFNVLFDTGSAFIRDPFMMTVTCRS